MVMTSGFAAWFEKFKQGIRSLGTSIPNWTSWLATAELLALLLLLFPVGGHAASVSAEELSEANRWVAAKFEGREVTELPRAYLMIYTRSGSIERDGVRGQVTSVYQPAPLRIADKVYGRGLHFPTEGKVIVHLPAPGRNFDALAGVDSNDLGYYSNRGQGSVTANVEVNGTKAFTSSVMREGMPAVPVTADLKGAEEFTLEVSGTGKGTVFGVDFDQADWVEARITLEDGRVLWLDQVPIGPLRGPYTTKVPFSFWYGGRRSSDFLGTWRVERSSHEIDAQRIERVLTYTDQRTGLEARCVAVLYRDFPTVEWTLHLKNTGTADTPIVDKIQPLDTKFERNNDGEYVLHYNNGSFADATDFEPFEKRLGPKDIEELTPIGGRSSNGVFPYFDVERPGGGVIVVVGWPGQWMARFSRDTARGLRIEAGQELTHFVLHAGEEVRTPLVVLQFYKGNWIRAQNIWRRWMILHNIPRVDGKLPPPHVAANSSHAFIEMQNANGANQKFFIRRYMQEGFKLDYWWMDAGWYPFKGSWVNTGTWEPDPKRFPHGLRAVSDYAHSKGIKIIVWFEPERVTPGTWLYEKHPEWLLKPPPNPGNQAYEQDWRLLDLGDPQARRWLIDHVSHLVKTQGIDLYRQDFNMDPLYFWRAHDATNRKGITEIRYVSGLLAYWDALRRRNPKLILDSCASGGRRMDLEALRRAIVLTRSDDIFRPISEQGHTYGVELWIPDAGTGIDGGNPYAFRSQMTRTLSLSWDLRRKSIDYPLLVHLVSQWRQVRDDYFGDYYPLTPYDVTTKAWIAWQFNRPRAGHGMIQAFRRPESDVEAMRFSLAGLNPEAEYRVTNLDSLEGKVFSGRELMAEGLLVELKHKPDSALILYERGTSNQPTPQ